MDRKARFTAAVLLLSLVVAACSTPTAPRVPESPSEEPEKPPPVGGGN